MKLGTLRIRVVLTDLPSVMQQSRKLNPCGIVVFRLLSLSVLGTGQSLASSAQQMERLRALFLFAKSVCSGIV